MPEATHPEDFDPIFSQGVVVVGGHAVNLWASYYAAHGDEELALFAPFTSKDADVFIRDKELARAIATTAGWKFRLNPGARSQVLALIIMDRGDITLSVDVLRTVRGLTDEDLARSVMIEFANGKRYSLPSPDLMLKAKLANLAAIDQSDRQDARHIRILVRCCANYLRDAIEAAREGAIGERDAVDLFMSVLKLIGGQEALRLDVAHGLSLSAAIPNKLDLRGLPKLEAFYRHQRKG